ncbi:YSIRK-type signal peptide-containing protein [uncultured Abiotrophia sp.]|uniref:YSIRK-type signal peptide-containing protein n=1 Tax=uncultured Abiotrophia sp. TaxID=316094 RepID=UPI0037DC916B
MQRFSIRKFSVGIASVVIGSFFIGHIAPVSAQALDNPKSNYVCTKLCDWGKHDRLTGRPHV